jgi:hypothetical protein
MNIFEQIMKEKNLKMDDLFDEKIIHDIIQEAFERSR